MKAIGIIPARYASSRFPGKPLAEIGGIPMIIRVLNQAQQCTLLDDLYVATDDERIANLVLERGGKAILTSSAHPTGTDRLLEVATKLPDFDIYLNIQGDEPFLNPQVPDELIRALQQDPQAEIATPVCLMTQTEKLFSPHVVKVVRNQQAHALYFSRQPIPFLREVVDQNEWISRHPYYQHIGVYAFRKSALEKIAEMKPSILEQAESLEQLRWLEGGLNIITCTTTEPGPAVDTPEDLQRIEKEYFPKGN